ncbi:MAG: carboxypeptidase regulatory-like domain-containing protein, partial [Myxococcales bacterium]|nr:carboxypeptidase regulatory-like domain-containing protein [Myxococcales bacterium]
MIAALLVAVALAAPPPAAEAAPPEVVPPALAAPLELPDAVPARRDLDVTVLVALTIGVDGAPSDLSVVRSPGEPWSRLALDALSRARFTPATRGGEPVAVRIVAPVPIGPRTTWLGVARREPEAVPTVAAGIRGVVLERGTRRPLAGVPVLLGEDGARETVTDADGRFAFPDLPAGRYRLEVPPFDHEGAVETATVPADVTIRLTANATREYVTRVERTRRAPTDSARIVVPVERAREVPGSSGDPLKVLESLPGVARPAAAGPGAGELAVRGSAPEDTRVYLDGLPLFQLYHFGNIYSVLQDEWIGDIDFRAGGYATEYGDATGGMVDVTLRELAKDGVHGHLDVNVYHVAALVTAPVSDTWTVGAAVRRSWVDSIIGGLLGDDPGFAFTTAPRYYDYQVRADHRPDATTLLKLVALGSDDEVVLLSDRPSADDPGGSGFSLGRSFHQL